MSKIPRLFELMPEKHKKAPAKRLHSARRGFLKKTRRQETILPEQGKNGGAGLLFLHLYHTTCRPHSQRGIVNP